MNEFNKNPWQIKANFFVSLVLIGILLNSGLWSSVEWNNTISFPNGQSSIQNSYNTSSSDIILQKGYAGASGSTYYAATAGTTTSVFSKLDSSNNPVWVKSYDPFTFYHAAFVVASDESAIYWVEEGAQEINILHLNANDGELVQRFVE